MTAADPRGDSDTSSQGAGPRPAPRRYLVLLASAVLAALITIYFLPGGELDRIAFLERPVTSVSRVTERQLELDEALSDAPEWLRFAARSTYDLTGHERERAIEALSEVSTSMRRRARAAEADGKQPSELVDELEDVPALDARLTVLLFESGRTDEARFALEGLEKSAGAYDPAAAIRRAYLAPSTSGARPFESYDLAPLGRGWCADHLRLALARATGASAAAEAIERELAARRAAVRDRAVRVCTALNLPVALGIVLLLLWIWRNHPDLGLGDAPIPPPWTWAAGLAVLVRSALFGIAIWFVLGVLDLWLSTRAFTLWVTLTASLPMLWLIRRRLLVPGGLSFSRAFGVQSALARPIVLATTTLGVIALDRLGGAAIQVMAANLGQHPHWTELVAEEWITASTAVLALGALDLVVFAPIAEEIGCRGLLYGSLRSKIGPWMAAVLSAGLFGLVHPYSPAGLAQALWTGFVYAAAYERAKSLAPVTASHAVHNLFAVVAGWSLYR